MADMGTLFEYACAIHTGAGKLSYQFVDTQEVQIVKRPVGDRKKEKPFVSVEDLYVTYEDLSEPHRYQMWVGQEWSEIKDSQDIKAARANIKKRSAMLDTYSDGDDVNLARTGPTTTVVTVPYDHVTAYLAQRPGFHVVEKSHGEDEEAVEEEEGGADSESSSFDGKTKQLAPRPHAPKPLAPKPLAPKSHAPKPLAPKPQAPKPQAPKPTEKTPKQHATKQSAPKKKRDSDDEDDDNKYSSKAKAPTSPKHTPSKVMMDDEDDDNDDEDVETKAGQMKRKSDFTVIGDTPKRARTSHQASEDILRDIIKRIVSKDMLRNEEYKASLDGVRRLAHTLAEDLDRV